MPSNGSISIQWSISNHDSAIKMKLGSAMQMGFYLQPDQANKQTRFLKHFQFLISDVEKYLLMKSVLQQAIPF